jgi:hypothetical protein
MPFTNPSSSPSSWYVVYTESGSVAVVHVEDMVQLIGSGLVCLARRVSFEEGACFERLRADYMSANHRIKAGESGGVG